MKTLVPAGDHEQFRMDSSVASTVDDSIAGHSTDVDVEYDLHVGRFAYRFDATEFPRLTVRPVKDTQSMGVGVFQTNRVLIVAESGDLLPDESLVYMRRLPYALRPFVILTYSESDTTLESVTARATTRNATNGEPNVTSPWIEEELDRLFLTAEEEQFEPGMESRMSVSLQRVFAYSPMGVLQTLQKRLENDQCIDVEVLAEALRWVGDQDSEDLRSTVTGLLVAGLRHGSPIVRDVAALSLARLEGIRSVPHLARALESEIVPELREDLESLVSSLQR